MISFALGLPAALILLVLWAGWAVRGKSSQVFGPSLWRGPDTRRALALTFDDGPSELTPVLLELLASHQARATFFLCGEAARRYPRYARAIRDAGHEIGNHSEHHARLWLRSPQEIGSEIAAAQRSLSEVLGPAPRLFRPPYGVRWFGLAGIERGLGLTRVMWSGVGRDWVLDVAGIVRRLRSATYPGAILLLHDGPHASCTPDALRELLPWWAERGYALLTVSELTGPDGPSAPSDDPEPR